MVNSGNAALTFPTSASGTDPSIATGFTLGGSSTCPQLSVSSIPMTLAVGASCTDLVSFSPNASGTIGGSPVITDNALNAPGPSYTTQSVALSGTSRLLAPTIVFTVPNHTYGDAPFVVSASSNSTGAFTYTVVSGPATISGATVTLTAAGTVVVQASEASDTNHTAGSSNATFSVAAATPTIVFAVPNHTYGDAPFVVSASSNSTGAFTYTVVSGPATISGTTVTLTGTGTVVLRSGNGVGCDYYPHRRGFGGSSGLGSIDRQLSCEFQYRHFTVSAATPTLAFNVLNHTYGDAAFPVAASSNSTGGFTYTVVSGPATIVGSTVTLTGAGLVTLSASQAATQNYAAGNVATTFLVTASLALSSTAGGSSSTQTIPAGTAATFSLTFTPGGGTYFNPLVLSVSGLPAGATGTFFPGTIPAGAGPTSVILIVQTSAQTALNEGLSGGKPFHRIAWALLLMPLLGLKPVRRRLGYLPTLLALFVLSLAATSSLSGCGSGATTSRVRATLLS